jgi:hypothetical protein
MMDCRQAICRVSMSGSGPAESKPDIRSICVISDLASICRVCRVLLGVESPGENKILSIGLDISSYLTDSIGLE